MFGPAGLPHGDGDGEQQIVVFALPPCTELQIAAWRDAHSILRKFLGQRSGEREVASDLQPLRLKQYLDAGDNILLREVDPKSSAREA